MAMPSPIKCARPIITAGRRSLHPGHPGRDASGPSWLVASEGHDANALSSRLRASGYAATTRRLLSPRACRLVKERMPGLFRGEFKTGVYPDEWHWREGISRPDAAREMCNAWKSDRTVASIVLDEGIGRLVAEVMGWESVRIAQDDLVWKPPSSPADAGEAGAAEAGRIDTVGFHQDSAYISTQFDPYENNSVTVWMALDDADEENGCVEYAVGSHLWRPNMHEWEGSRQRDLRHDGDAANAGISSFHSSDEASYRDGLSEAARLAGVSNPTGTIEPVPTVEGCAILHHQDVWHGSGPNASHHRHRRALVGHYLRGDATFRECAGRGGRGPFGSTGYIYGRYRRHGVTELEDSFFPVIYGENRTPWLDEFANA